MHQKITSKSMALLLVLTLTLHPKQADAFWWLVGTNAARTAATTGARTAVAGAATAGATATANAGRLTAAEAATARSGAAVSGSSRTLSSANTAQSLVNRYCVRRLNERNDCDWRVEERAYDAAAKAVGSRYRIAPTSRPMIFEVIDAVGTVVDVIQVINSLDDPSVVNAPQAQAGDGSQQAFTGSAAMMPESPISNGQPTRLNSWVLEANHVPVVVWSNGPVVVWMGQGERRELAAGQSVRFLNIGSIHVQGLAPQATELFHRVEVVAESPPRNYNQNFLAPTIPPANGRINHRQGDQNPCPYAGTVPIEWVNGSVRCGRSR